MRRRALTLSLISTVFLAGCDNNMGTDAWCEQLELKPADHWTVPEAEGYAEHCLSRVHQRATEDGQEPIG